MGAVLGQVYCHQDYYNFSRELQGGGEGGKQNNGILSINSHFIISCDSIACIHNIFFVGLKDICGHPSVKTGRGAG